MTTLYEVRSADLKNIHDHCGWVSKEVAIAEAKLLRSQNPESNCVVVRHTRESALEAERARLDWMLACARYDDLDDFSEAFDRSPQEARRLIDEARKAPPEQIVQIWPETGK